MMMNQGGTADNMTTLDPNSLETESEVEVICLLDNLGLQEKQQFPISQHKCYIAKNGTPVLIPSDPIALIRNDFLSAQSKMS